MTVNLTRIYTRLGDGGETHLGDMSRVPKTHPRIEAYGTVDELNAQIGVALAGDDLPEKYAGWLRRVQNDLFDVGADISVPHGGDRSRLRVVPEQTEWLEQACDEVNADLPKLRSFVLPGGTPAAAQLHVCRTVCRRAERRTIDCGDDVSAECVQLPEPALRPALHPVARREPRRRGRGAAVGAGRRAMSLSEPSEQGLYPAEHRALRELYAMARQLARHWDRLARPARRRRGRGADRRAPPPPTSCWASWRAAPPPTGSTASRPRRASAGGWRTCATSRATSCWSATRRCAPPSWTRRTSSCS